MSRPVGANPPGSSSAVDCLFHWRVWAPAAARHTATSVCLAEEEAGTYVRAKVRWSELDAAPDLWEQLELVTEADDRWCSSVLRDKASPWHTRPSVCRSEGRESERETRAPRRKRRSAPRCRSRSRGGARDRFSSRVRRHFLSAFPSSFRLELGACRTSLTIACTERKRERDRKRQRSHHSRATRTLLPLGGSRSPRLLRSESAARVRRSSRYGPPAHVLAVAEPRTTRPRHVDRSRSVAAVVAGQPADRDLDPAPRGRPLRRDRAQPAAQEICRPPRLHPTPHARRPLARLARVESVPGSAGRDLAGGRLARHDRGHGRNRARPRAKVRSGRHEDR